MPGDSVKLTEFRDSSVLTQRVMLSGAKRVLERQ